MKVLLLTVIVVSLGSQVFAQTVINPATAYVEFMPNDLPNAPTSAFRPSVWPAAADGKPIFGVPVALGTDVPKAALAIVSATVSKLTFAQAGLSTKIPVCTTATGPAGTPCPPYALMILGVASDGTTTSAVDQVSVSPPFTLARSVVAPTPPVRPTNVLVKSL